MTLTRLLKRYRVPTITPQHEARENEKIRLDTQFYQFARTVRPPTMAIPRNKAPSVRMPQRSKHAKDKSAAASVSFQEKLATGREQAQAERQTLLEEHLPPVTLTVAILLCSGFCFLFALRDFLTTGKQIGGTWDEAMLVRASVCVHFVCVSALADYQLILIFIYFCRLFVWCPIPAALYQKYAVVRRFERLEEPTGWI